MTNDLVRWQTSAELPPCRRRLVVMDHDGTICQAQRYKDGRWVRVGPIGLGRPKYWMLMSDLAMIPVVEDHP